MALTNIDTWIVQHSNLLSRSNIASLKEAVNADIKESGRTVRAKRPVQQLKQAIVLVQHQAARSIPESDYYKLRFYLNEVAQRACV